jgi:hypothetical protein
MIIINLLRVFNGSLEVNIETDSNYKFKNLYIWSSSDSNVWTPSLTTVDLGSHLDKVSNKEIKNIPLNDITTDILYYIQFTIEWNGTGSEIVDNVLFSNASVADLSTSYSKKVAVVKDLYNPLSLNKDLLYNIYISENLMKMALSLERFEDANYYCNELKKLII